jgi:transcriptional regulator with XRE-family HTH domain
MASNGNNGDMPKKRMTVSERIREAVETAEVTRYQIAQETGIEQSALTRFLSKERTLSMKAIDALAEYFGLELVRRKAK